MTSDAAVRKIGGRIRTLNRRLRKTGGTASNAHLALWGALAIAQFDGNATLVDASPGDAEMTLSDLLADLMHWCDSQPPQSGNQRVVFDSALEQAREYYRQERGGKLKTLLQPGGKRTNTEGQ